MKKFFTLVAMATMVLAANAQTENGIVVDPATKFSLPDEGATINSRTVLNETASVTWMNQGDNTFKAIAMYGDADPVNAVTIDGVKYVMTPGLQGSGNGKDANADHSAPTAFGGAEAIFSCKGTGYLYVFSKTSYNKKYYVYDGEFESNSGNMVAYTQWMAPYDGTAVVSYTLPADELGYVVWPTEGEYPQGHFFSAQAYKQPSDMPGCETYKTGNSLGVIAFPVYGVAESSVEYCVFASGSKITTNGFVFIPNDNPTLENMPAPTFSKEETGTGIANVEAVENAKAAPVKVIKNGQIMIGDFNIAGQRVK